MTMQAVRTISTPWTPYSVMFSRDGTRLAIGGGVFYGNGGIMMVDLSNGGEELFPCDRLPHAQADWVPAVSGVCFSDDDRHLAASSWRGRHHYAPTLLFDVSALKLTHRSTLTEAVRGFTACPTGVLLSDRYTITRNHRASPDETLVISESPRELDIRARHPPQHLTGSHLAVVGNHAITAGRGLMLDGVKSEDRRQALLDFRESGRAVAEGLVSLDLDVEARTPQLIPVQGSREVTAIAATPDGEGFLTGGLDGELDQWSWEGYWRQKRLRACTVDAPGVSGICYLYDGAWATVSSSGRLDLMARNAPVATWQLPTPGSPRALAAHPARHWLAIGMKQGSCVDPRGVVDIIEIKLPVAPGQ